MCLLHSELLLLLLVAKVQPQLIWKCVFWTAFYHQSVKQPPSSVRGRFNSIQLKQLKKRKGSAATHSSQYNVYENVFHTTHKEIVAWSMGLEKEESFFIKKPLKMGIQHIFLWLLELRCSFRQRPHPQSDTTLPLLIIWCFSSTIVAVEINMGIIKPSILANKNIWIRSHSEEDRHQLVRYDNKVAEPERPDKRYGVYRPIYLEYECEFNERNPFSTFNDKQIWGTLLFILLRKTTLLQSVAIHPRLQVTLEITLGFYLRFLKWMVLMSSLKSKCNDRTCVYVHKI